jgi:cytochrome c oxidase subunit 1
MYNETWGRIACALVFIGFNMTFLTQFILGSRGMPRRYANYLDQFQPLHAFSTVGSWVLGLGLFITAGYLLASLAQTHGRARQSLGRHHARMEDFFSAHHAQLRGAAVLERAPYDYRPEVTHV